MASDLSNSTVCQENPELRRLAEDYSSVVYQLGHTTDDLSVLSQKTVVDPMKKLVGEFPNIQASVKKRDLALQVWKLIILSSLIQPRMRINIFSVFQSSKTTICPIPLNSSSIL